MLAGLAWTPWLSGARRRHKVRQRRPLALARCLVPSPASALVSAALIRKPRPARLLWARRLRRRSASLNSWRAAACVLRPSAPTTPPAPFLFYSGAYHAKRRLPRYPRRALTWHLRSERWQAVTCAPVAPSRITLEGYAVAPARLAVPDRPRLSRRRFKRRMLRG